MAIAWRILTLTLILTLAVGLLGGCGTITRSTTQDYGVYLQRNQHQLVLPKVNAHAAYAMDEATRKHSTEIRPMMARGGDAWVVEFGTVLDETMRSADVRQALGSVQQRSSLAGHPGLGLDFRLVAYEFTNMRASIALHVKATDGGRTVVDKTYQGQGRSQGGKMYWGGAFAMKNAIQQSTKTAMDQLMLELFTDLQTRQASR